MTTVLVVDDEPIVREVVVEYLRRDGFRTVEAGDGRSAKALVESEHPDLVVLDLMLPEEDGLSVCRWIRSRSALPVIMLTARGEEADRIVGLELGADDYVTKPFGMNELLARMRAALRRGLTSDGEEAVVTTPDFEIDLAVKRATRGGQDARLTPTEWALVEALVRNRGRLVSQRWLLQEVWGPAYDKETNYLRVHFANIRRKLEPEPSRPRYFITEPGMGYRFEG